MSIKYSVEVSYKLDNELHISLIEFLPKYMQFISENKEIVEKDNILNQIGTKYNTYMNSHDFDIKSSDPTKLGTVLLRNTNFLLTDTNVINFIKDIPDNYQIQYINREVNDKLYRIYNINTKTNNKKFTELDKEILKIVNVKK